ncbi:hypothetical protein DB30_00250 [Enhygromyxa salina]|uniref:Uncharacterized protein n=2 Tax=Enhygromyxa salina TaxID=215803 RepID=A0A0C2DAM6_9BACT|nr:hypothetical protein DB30_00250 [Enhygromyxa salina]
MIHAIRDAEAAANAARNKNFAIEADFFFIEKRRQNIEVLEATLRIDPTAIAYEKQGRIHVLRGSFEDRVAEIVAQVETKGRAGRAIFLLDQYGYTNVPLATLRDIMARLPRAEFLLTFATDWLID